MTPKTTTSRLPKLGTVLLVLFALTCPVTTDFLELSPLGGLVGPAPAYGQACTYYIFEVVEGDYSMCNSGYCTAEIWVHIIEDDVEIGFEDAGIPGEPIQQKNCYSALECNSEDSPQCDFDPLNKPCNSTACTEYMLECGVQRTIAWWENTMVVDLGFPPLGQGEACGNEDDDDCDGLIDDDDPDCSAGPKWGAAAQAEASMQGSALQGRPDALNILGTMLFPIGVIICLKTLRRKK